MELLVIKTGNDYMRIKEGNYTAVGLDKASVFPIDRLEQVKEHLIRIQDSGCREAAICRLSLTETPL